MQVSSSFLKFRSESAQRPLTVLALSAALALAGCGGGDSTPGNPADTLSLSGFYMGTSTGRSPNAMILIAPDGQMFGRNPQSTAVPAPLTSLTDVYQGTVYAQGTTWQSNSLKVADSSSLNVPTLTPLNLQGSFVKGVSATASLSSTSTLAYNALDLSYQSQSDVPASLGAVAGTYTNASTGLQMTVSSTGVMSGTFRTGCTIAANIAVTDPSKNVYRINGSLSGSACTIAGNLTALSTQYASLSLAQTYMIFMGNVSSTTSNSGSQITLALPKTS